MRYAVESETEKISLMSLGDRKSPRSSSEADLPCPGAAPLACVSLVISFTTSTGFLVPFTPMNVPRKNYCQTKDLMARLRVLSSVAAYMMNYEVVHN